MHKLTPVKLSRTNTDSLLITPFDVISMCVTTKKK